MGHGIPWGPATPHAVNSLAYEADMRLRDPVYGCIAVVSILQRNLHQLQQDLARAKYELSKYQAAAAAVSAGPTWPQAMAEFIGNTAPNGAQSFINVGHSVALGSIGGGDGFGQEQFAAVQMLSRSYEGEPIARLGVSGGYEFGYSTAMAGAMVWGGIRTEKLQLNHDILWTGMPGNYTDPKASAALAVVRKLVDDGQFVDATKAAQVFSVGQQSRLGWNLMMRLDPLESILHKLSMKYKNIPNGIRMRKLHSFQLAPLQQSESDSST